MPGIVLRPGQIVTTATGQRYLVLLKQGNNWLCEHEGAVVERTSGFLRTHGVRLEWNCNLDNREQPTPQALCEHARRAASDRSGVHPAG